MLPRLEVPAPPPLRRMRPNQPRRCTAMSATAATIGADTPSSGWSPACAALPAISTPQRAAPPPAGAPPLPARRAHGADGEHVGRAAVDVERQRRRAEHRDVEVPRAPQAALLAHGEEERQRRVRDPLAA